MADKLFLELVSPEKLLVSSEVDNVFAHGAGGAFGLYPDHSPFCTELIPCVLSYAVGQETFKVAVSGGFLTVSDNKVNVLADGAVPSADINADVYKSRHEKAVQALDSAENDEERKLRQKELDFLNAALSLL